MSGGQGLVTPRGVAGIAGVAPTPAGTPGRAALRYCEGRP